MGPRLLRIRALSASVIALLVFQMSFVQPVANAADPTPSPTESAQPLPSGDPQPTPGSTPSETIPPTPPSPLPVPPSDPVVEPPKLPNDGGIGVGDVPALRTATSQTFDNKDGSFTAQIFPQAVFYQPNGSSDWEPIQLGFASSKAPGVDAISDKAPATVALSDVGSKTGFVKVSSGPTSVSFILPGADKALAQKPTINGPAADYLDALPGVDLRVLPENSGAKSFLIWHAQPADPTVSFSVDAPGLTLKAQDDGSIAFYDQAGTKVGEMPRPYATDSTPNAELGSGIYTDKVSYILGADGTSVTVAVDPTWLATAVYPVYVDPTFNVDNAGSTNYGDAHIASAYTTTNFADYQRPDSPYYHELWLGTDPSGTSGTSYDYLRWNLSSIMGYTVDTASFTIDPYHQYYNAPTATTTWLLRVTGINGQANWVETYPTWSHQYAATNTGQSTAGCVEATTCTFTTNVKAMVQAWLDGTNPNYGIRLDEDNQASTYWKRVIAAEQGGANVENLTFTYHTPVTPLYPTGGGLTSSTTLSWTADSTWAAAAHYQVDVASNSGFSPILWSSGDVTSAADDAAIGTALTPGTTYYWRVKVKDATGTPTWTPFSATASFVYDLGNLGMQSQSSFETWDLGGGDQASVNVSTGNLVLTHPIVTLPIRGGSLSLSLTYNSQDPNSIGMGPGWRLNVQRRLVLNGDGTVTFIDGDDARYTFTNPVTVGTVTTYTRPAALFATLKEDTSQSVEFTLTYRDQSRDTFDIAGTEGLLTRAEDRHGNGVTIAYVTGTNRIDTITDTAGGRTINFVYDGSLRVSSITDWAYQSSGVVQTTATGTRRVTSFLYDGSGNLASWADPLVFSGTCTLPAGLHMTCFTYGATLTITKAKTLESFAGGDFTTALSADVTTFSLVGGEVTSVKDGNQYGLSPATTFTRAASEMIVVRQGTPSTTTTYGFVAPTDPYARVQSVWRLFGSTNIEDRTVFDTTFLTLPATDTANYGALLSTPARVVTTTYVPGSLGLVARTIEPLTSSPATNRQTDNAYNANNDLVQTIVSQDGSGTLQTTTRYCYDSGCTLTSTGLDLLGQVDNYVSGGAQNADTNVTTNNTYDAYGQRLTETRHNRDASGAIRDDRVTAFSYDTLGDQIAQIANYANGTVTSPGDDITPNATTGARTDLTTSYGYDTAGNRVSTADPRRAIEAAKGTTLGADDYVNRSTYDPLEELLVQTLPTTPASLGGVACSPDPSCRQSSSVYDEIGGVMKTSSYANPSGTRLTDYTVYDYDEQATLTYEDPDGPGGVAAAVSAKTVFDQAGRAIDFYDRIQAGSSAAGYTLTAYDGLGRTTDVTAASASTPNVASVTHSVYDALSRLTQNVVGYGGPDPQTTGTTYDLGGRAITTNDGFTCETATFDYQDRAVSETTGLTGSCGTVAGQTVTTVNSIDGIGRTYRQEITSSPNTGDRSQDDTFDAVGNRLTAATRTAGVTLTTTLTVNLLDQDLAEMRPDGTTAKTNYDPVGSPTDACSWASGLTVGACLSVGTIPWTNPPSQATTTAYDARSQRISLADSTSSMTIVYNPSVGYEIAATYLPTGSGNEFQSLYGYDTRNRLSTLTQQLCVVSTGHSCSSTTTVGSNTYAYDDNDNRKEVNENNGGAATDYLYCYDARNQLTARGSGGACSSPTETNSYDVAGNRTQAVAGGTTTNYQYNGLGQLCRVNGTNCTTGGSAVSYDSAGRVSAYGAWTYYYDSSSRLIKACDTATCSTSGDKVEFAYDGQGHRTEIKTTSAAAVVSTTDFTYEGDAIVAEKLTDAGHPTGAIVRTYVVDPSGAIEKMTIATGESGAGTYLVIWNGHGDALSLQQVQGDGTLRLANAYVYTTWGVPTTVTYNSIPDLGFRFLYVGLQDVQWDNPFGLGLLYMHARHYLPSLGQFIQPDPGRSDLLVYGYAGHSPVTGSDPAGTLWHTVRRGDTLWDLATVYLGSGYLAWQIVQANLGRLAQRRTRLQVGECIWIPSTLVHVRRSRCDESFVRVRLVRQGSCVAAVVAGSFVIVGLGIWDAGLAAGSVLGMAVPLTEFVLVPIDLFAIWTTQKAIGFTLYSGTHGCKELSHAF